MREVDRFRAETLARLPSRIADVPTRWAEETPAAPVVHAGSGTWTYADLAAGIDEAASALGGAGVRGGDRVLLVMENCFEALCAFYAITALDAWAAMANARLSPREIDVAIDCADARFAVFAEAVSPEARAHAEARGAEALAGFRRGGLALAVVRPGAAPEPVEEDPARRIAALLFTSGTTGRPKGAMLSHRTMLYQGAVVGAGRFVRGDCPYVVAPFVHILGLCGLVVPLIHVGAAFEFSARFDADTVLEGLAAGRLTHVFGAPPVFAALVAKADASGGAIPAPRLRQILAGGAPVDPALREAAERAFGTPLGAGYAATEFAPIASSPPGERPNAGAAGYPWPGNEIRLVGADGAEVADGEVGEVQCRGPNAMAGYFRDPEATAAAIDSDGWVSIGDLARIDEDGQIHVVGRLKELILRSGFNVYPPEVEAVLSNHRDVAQAAVVGRDVEGNEEVIAFVEPVPGRGIDVAALAVHAAGQLAPYKRPSRIVALDALPVGPTGKIDRVGLKDRARELPE